MGNVLQFCLVDQDKVEVNQKKRIHKIDSLPSIIDMEHSNGSMDEAEIDQNSIKITTPIAVRKVRRNSTGSASSSTKKSHLNADIEGDLRSLHNSYSNSYQHSLYQHFDEITESSMVDDDASRKRVSPSISADNSAFTTFTPPRRVKSFDSLSTINSVSSTPALSPLKKLQKLGELHANTNSNSSSSNHTQGMHPPSHTHHHVLYESTEAFKLTFEGQKKLGLLVKPATTISPVGATGTATAAAKRPVGTAAKSTTTAPKVMKTKPKPPPPAAAVAAAKKNIKTAPTTTTVGAAIPVVTVPAAAGNKTHNITINGAKTNNETVISTDNNTGGYSSGEDSRTTNKTTQSGRSTNTTATAKHNNTKPRKETVSTTHDVTIDLNNLTIKDATAIVNASLNFYSSRKQNKLEHAVKIVYLHYIVDNNFYEWSRLDTSPTHPTQQLLHTNGNRFSSPQRLSLSETAGHNTLFNSSPAGTKVQPAVDHINLSAASLSHSGMHGMMHGSVIITPTKEVFPLRYKSPGRTSISTLRPTSPAAGTRSRSNSTSSIATAASSSGLLLLHHNASTSSSAAAALPVVTATRTLLRTGSSKDLSLVMTVDNRATTAAGTGMASGGVGNSPLGGGFANRIGGGLSPIPSYGSANSGARRGQFEEDDEDEKNNSIFRDVVSSRQNNGNKHKHSSSSSVSLVPSNSTDLTELIQSNLNNNSNSNCNGNSVSSRSPQSPAALLKRPASCGNVFSSNINNKASPLSANLPLAQLAYLQLQEGLVTSPTTSLNNSRVNSNNNTASNTPLSNNNISSNNSNSSSNNNTSKQELHFFSNPQLFESPVRNNKAHTATGGASTAGTAGTATHQAQESNHQHQYSHTHGDNKSSNHHLQQHSTFISPFPHGMHTSTYNGHGTSGGHGHGTMNNLTSALYSGEKLPSVLAVRLQEYLVTETRRVKERDLSIINGIMNVTVRPK